MSDFINRDSWDGQYKTVECRKALSPSGLPGIDYALNPYSGCAHGCIYCYAPEVTHSEWSTWRVVKVKENIVERLSKEVPGLDGVIGIGTVTDPYQYAESRFELTQQCLDVIARTDLSVHIHTKSDLVLRDKDLIGGLKHEIGVTVTTVEDSVSKRVEPGAPLPDVRFDTMSQLIFSGLNVYALVGPVMSTMRGSEERFVNKVASAGVRRVCIDKLNLRPQLEARLSRMGIGCADDSVSKLKDMFAEVGISVTDAF